MQPRHITPAKSPQFIYSHPNSNETNIIQHVAESTPPRKRQTIGKDNGVQVALDITTCRKTEKKNTQTKDVANINRNTAWSNRFIVKKKMRKSLRQLFHR